MIFITIIGIIIGLIFLIKGSDWMISSAATIAKQLGISEIVIGLTVIAFGTSLPELVVNIQSALFGSTALAYGNIVGSNIANILLILGIGALVAPLTVAGSTKWREIPLALLAAAALVVVSLDKVLDRGLFNTISRGEGILLIFFFIIFLVYIYQLVKGQEKEVETVREKASLWLKGGVLIGGLITTMVGGWITVTSAVSLAQYLGISEVIIGLTVVAVGTSLPELVATIMAGMKGHADLAVGNIVGSNIFNIFWILGVTSIIQPIVIPDGSVTDAIIAFSATILLVVFTLFDKKSRLGKKRGMILLVAYIVYLIIKVIAVVR